MAIVRRSPSLALHMRNENSEGSFATADHVRSKAKSLGIAILPLDIEAIVKNYGLSLIREPMDNEISGYLERRAGAWVVGVNNLHHPRRQRFSIAHELAHFLLHSIRQDEFIDKTFLRYKDEASNLMEREADQFAGELLMPENEFRAIVKLGTTSVAELANYFDTSSMAIRYRARQLGFLKSGI